MEYFDHCSKCPKDDNCCTYRDGDGFVTVGIDCAEKIRKKTGMDFKDFLDFSPLHDKMVEFVLNERDVESIVRKKQLLNGRLLRFKLKKNGDCMFYGKDKRCQIYDVRPWICRIYPFWYEKVSDKGSKTKNSKASFKITLADNEKCDLCEACVNRKGKTMKINLAKEHENELKKIAAEIESDAGHYVKNIRKFAKENKLM